MSGMYGADPEHLSQLGSTLQRQIEAIGQVTTTVSAALSGTTWVGPARERFETDWNGTFKSALSRLNEAFEAAGTDCANRSQELARVMGS